MASKQLALLAAALGIATPVHAFDTRTETQTVMFYYAVPLDAKSKKERHPWMGMQINGKRDYQSYSMDAPLYTFNVAEAEGGASAASLVLLGVVAVGAAVAVSSRGKSSQQQVQQQQQAQQAAKPAPVPCPTDCAK